MHTHITNLSSNIYCIVHDLYSIVVLFSCLLCVVFIQVLIKLVSDLGMISQNQFVVTHRYVYLYRLRERKIMTSYIIHYFMLTSVVLIFDFFSMLSPNYSK